MKNTKFIIAPLYMIIIIIIPLNVVTSSLEKMASFSVIRTQQLIEIKKIKRGSGISYVSVEMQFSSYKVSPGACHSVPDQFSNFRPTLGVEIFGMNEENLYLFGG